MGPVEMRRAYNVMYELRSDLDEESYMAALNEMVPRGYRLFSLRRNGRDLALAGVGFGVTFYYGRYLWLYDLVTKESELSKGHGARLIEHLQRLARAKGCDMIALASRLDGGAHRFYEERAGFERASFTFHKPLS